MAHSAPEKYAFAAVSCGRDHSLALLDTGRLIGWGGDGSGNPPSSVPNYCASEKAASAPVMVEAPAIAAMAAGYGVSVAIDTAGRVLAWGIDKAGIGGP